MGVRGLLAAAIVSLTLAACTIDQGSAFEEQFRPFLADRDRLESFEVRGYNDFPWVGSADVTVVLDADLSQDEIVEEVLSIAQHEVDVQVSYDLHARFAAENGSGADAVTSVLVKVGSPMPETARSRDIVAERVERAFDVASADPGLVEFRASRRGAEVITESDPFDVAPALHALLRRAGEMENYSIVREEDGRIRLAPGASLANLDQVRGLLDSIDVHSAVQSWTLSATPIYGEPSLSVTITDELRELAVFDQRAAQLGLTLTINPVTPNPVAPRPDARRSPATIDRSVALVVSR